MGWTEYEQAWRQTPHAQEMNEWERQQFLANAKTGYMLKQLPKYVVIGLICLFLLTLL